MLINKNGLYCLCRARGYQFRVNTSRHQRVKRINGHNAGGNLQQAIEEFVSSRRIAVVGVSRENKKFGNSIYSELLIRGYDVYGINPSMDHINGRECFPNISALRGLIDAVVICISPAKVEPVLREAVRIGVKNVWLQQGCETIQTVTLGKLLGLNVVAGKCILMYMEPVKSFHSVHRFFARLLRKF